MPPRMHHVVPQFYLSGFTEAGTEDGKLHVTDIQRRKTWTSTPLKTARERDFYSPDDPGTIHAAIIENGLAQFEARMAPIFRDISLERFTGSPADSEEIMWFVAFMAVRTPPTRAFVNNVLDRELKKRVLDWVSTDESLAASCESAGVTEADGQKLRDFANSNDYTISLGNSWFLNRMWESALSLWPALRTRDWTIITAATDEAVLICSDFPVSIIPASAHEMKLPPNWRPRTIMIPLDRRHVLFSDTRGPACKLTLNTLDIAKVNTSTIAKASQVYSGRENFPWCDPGGRVLSSSALLDRLGGRNDKDE